MAVEYSVGGLGIDIKLNGVETALSQISEIQKQLNSKTLTGGSGSSSKGNSTSKLAKTISLASTLGKFHYYLNTMKQYGRSLGKVVQYAINYNETMNLWQVAMRNNIGLAENFISKMNRAYGISEQTLMNYQAIFKNMLSALGGLSENTSYMLSEYMTQWALDFSSLYNVTIERAMTIFQAVLSGQVRPIRSISGYDITENTIFDIYQQAGGNKTVRGLSQIEKRLLRIYAVFTQMSATGAIGDLTKTLEQPANQLRILAEQSKEMFTWLGQMFLMILRPILPKINAVIIFAKELFKAMSFTLGYKEQDFLSGLYENVSETNDEVDELQGKLFSFDKFNVLGGGDMTTALGVDPIIQSLIENLKTANSDITTEAQKLAETWLNKLGFVYDEEKGHWIVTEEAQKFLNTINAIGIALGIVFGIGVINTIGKLFTSLLSINWVVAGIAVAIGGIAYMFSQWELFTDSQKIIGIITTVTAALFGLAVAMMAFHASWSMGLAAAGIAAGIAAAAYTIMNTKNSVSMYADGGFPTQGQMFIARENGAELVGNIGNKTAVANNDQIVDSVSGGVRDAIQPLVVIGKAIYNVIKDGGATTITLDGQVLANKLTPHIKDNLRREGVVL
jgi:hypothetical protein